MFYLLVVLSIAIAGCVATQPKKVAGATPRHALSGNELVAGNGKTYRFHLADFPQIGAAEAAANCTCTRWSGAADGDVFNGCARRDAKTSFVDVNAHAVREFSSIVGLKTAIRQEWQADDDHMRNDLSPKLTCDPASQRYPEEQQNVAVTAFIIAMTKESDNDFHLILGDDGCNDASCFMNAEVSGITASDNASYQDLENARASYLTLVGGNEPKAGSRYVTFDDKMPIRVEGSLFYDIDHPAGVVGPQCCRPDTSWEIHPIRNITFASQ